MDEFTENTNCVSHSASQNILHDHKHETPDLTLLLGRQDECALGSATLRDMVNYLVQALAERYCGKAPGVLEVHELICFPRACLSMAWLWAC